MKLVSARERRHQRVLHAVQHDRRAQRRRRQLGKVAVGGAVHARVRRPRARPQPVAPGPEVGRVLALRDASLEELCARPPAQLLPQQRRVGLDRVPQRSRVHPTALPCAPMGRVTPAGAPAAVARVSGTLAGGGGTAAGRWRPLLSRNARAPPARPLELSFKYATCTRVARTTTRRALVRTSHTPLAPPPPALTR